MTHKRRICIVGASGKLGRYMVQHTLDRDYDVVGVCRPESVDKLAEPGARLIFSCGWHISLDGKDAYSRSLKAQVAIGGRIGKLLRMADLDDQVEACRRIFASNTQWTVVRGSDLREGDSEGLPAWAHHVGDPILESNRTKRIDFALFMVEALTNDELIRAAPAIVGCRTESAMAHS